MSIHIHLGAHKTASTHIQAILRENAALLSAAKVRYAPPSEVRRLIGPARRAAAWAGFVPSPRAFVAARRIAALAGDERLLIVADENSLGMCAEVIMTGALYPTAAPRLRLLGRLAARRDTTAFLAIRDYAPFFSGVHAQAARGGRARALTAAELKAFAALPRRWPDVVRDIRRALPDARLILWRFEDYKALRARIPGMIAATDGLKPFRRRSMATPSNPAMEAIFAAAADRADQTLTIGEFDHMRATHDGARYMPFRADDHAGMSEAYSEDVARLRADPDVTFLAP